MAKNNGNAVAVLMKLKPGVTRGEIRELSALLERIGDPAWVDAWKRRDVGSKHRDPEAIGVRKYDDEYGDPDFYIP